MNMVGILLAAGRGRRFDPAGASNKLLAPLPTHDAVVVASARTLLASVTRVVAVVGQDEAVGAALRALGCEVTVCPDADTGMAASLAHGIRHAQSADGWLIALGDMPRVQAATMQALCGAVAAGAGIAAPVHAGRRGNPVAFHGRYLQALLALEGDQGARSLLQSEPVECIAVDDFGVLFDVDTPSDLSKTGTLPVSRPM